MMRSLEYAKIICMAYEFAGGMRLFVGVKTPQQATPKSTEDYWI